MSEKKSIRKGLLIAGMVLLLIVGFVGFKLYQAFLGPSVTSHEAYFYVYTGDSYDQVLERIKAQNIVRHPALFDFAAARMDYPDMVKPGRYKLTPGMNNRRFIGNLRGGYQDAVKLQFANIRLKEDFAGFLGRNFEADSVAFSAILNNEAVAEKYGF